MKKSKLKLKAYPQSVAEWLVLWEKFPAFAAGYVSDKLVEDGVLRNDSFGTGCNFLRNALIDDSIINMVASVDPYGAYDYKRFVDTGYMGARVAIEVIYDNELFSKTLYYETREQTLVVNVDGTPKYFEHPNGGHMTTRDVTSTAPIVTFGGYDYIWLNQEDCESQKSYTMKLVQKDISALSEIFNITDIHDIASGIVRSDFKDSWLHEQYLSLATQGCTPKELSLLVNVKMSNANNYQTTKPVLTLRQKFMIRKIIKNNKKAAK